MKQVANHWGWVVASVFLVAGSLCAEEPTGQVPAEGKPAAIEFGKDVLPFLKQHCFHCHGNGKHEAELSLGRFTDNESLQKDRKTWDNVLHMLGSGEMPPKERPRPPADQVELALKNIRAVLASLNCTQPRNVGRVTLRRLNRAEYNNTIRDLVGIDFKPAADFPADDVGYGFDNIGDVLSTTPLLFEKYFAAAEEIFERAIVKVEPIEPRKTGLNDISFTAGAGEKGRRRGVVLFGKGNATAEGFFEDGDYTVLAEVYGQQIGDEKVKATVSIGRRSGPVKSFEVTGKDRESAQTLELKTRLRKGQTRVSVSFDNPFTDESISDPLLKRRQLYVRSIVLDGPYNPPVIAVPETHRRLMAHADGAKPREAAREIVARFAERAFRRSVQPDEVERILGVYDLAEKEGRAHEQRVRLCLCRVLVSPHFLFRIEKDPSGAQPGQSYLLSEYELATRLSYFLWSTMPDEELFALAAKGELRTNLDVQVQRMLKDPKSSAFVENFTGQWLTLRKLGEVPPDPKLFPDYDDGLRKAMIRETELFFEAILREDRSILDFLDGNFTFLNSRLQYHYGMPLTLGREFQRVETPPGRGGLLTQASILTLTSHPTRTSPVKRGKWVLEQLLGTPPPPPPPDVPALDEQKQSSGSLRQALEQHRANAICASCHARMDPIGFAFENYDAIGRWRDKDGEFAIDPSGELPDGRKFQGPAELKTILRDKKELFARSLSEKMLVYAIGRGVEHYDQCAIDKILAALDKNDYRFSTLIVETVKSEPFQMRTATGEKP